MAFPHKTAAFPNLARGRDAAAAAGAGDAAARRADAPRPSDDAGATVGDRHAGRTPDGRRPQRRRSGGRAARQALRLAAHAEHVPFLTRKLAPFEVLGEEGLSLIEHNADTILEEVGLEFRGDADALRLLRDAGADVEGERVRFPRGMCRQIVQATAPRQFTQYARNPERNVEIGGMHTVFAPELRLAVRARPRQRPPLRHDRGLPQLREAGLRCRPYLHHSGGTVCEPVDVPVNKRHLDMVYTHIRYSDKPFMGSVTAPERARDTVEMARLTFGADYLEDHAVIPQPDQRQLAARLGLDDARAPRAPTPRPTRRR